MRTRKKLIFTAAFFLLIVFVWKKESIRETVPQKQPEQETEKPDEPEAIVQETVENEVIVTFIDVGQGDCTLIMDNGQTMLIDTGAYEGYENIETVLSEKNIATIDVMVLTHPDADHIQNAEDIIKNYTVEEVYMPDIENDTKTYQRLMSAVEEYNIKVICPDAGDMIEFGKAEYEIVAPEAESTYEDVNSSSIVIHVTNGEDSFLFTGDATGEEMNSVYAAGYDISADVLKASHHGSANHGCNDELLFYNVNPDIVVVMCGYGNEYGHPHVETMELAKRYGCKLYRTDLQGTVECVSTGNGIEWEMESCTNFKTHCKGQRLCAAFSLYKNSISQALHISDAPFYKLIIP